MACALGTRCACGLRGGGRGNNGRSQTAAFRSRPFDTSASAPLIDAKAPTA
jgi:hypothetical protein